MNELINTIRHAHSGVMHAIHEAGRDLQDDPEFGVLLGRLQECGVSLREAENQAVCIKTRRDLEVEVSAERARSDRVEDDRFYQERNDARHGVLR